MSDYSCVLAIFINGKKKEKKGTGLFFFALVFSETNSRLKRAFNDRLIEVNDDQNGVCRQLSGKKSFFVDQEKDYHFIENSNITTHVTYIEKTNEEKKKEGCLFQSFEFVGFRRWF